MRDGPELVDWYLDGRQLTRYPGDPPTPFLASYLELGYRAFAAIHGWPQHPALRGLEDK